MVEVTEHEHAIFIDIVNGWFVKLTLMPKL